MSIASTKKEIKNYLIENTKKYGIDHLQLFTTNQISVYLNISRSLASQYLNELCKENKLIKVSSRPVYYFDKESLEEYFQIQLQYCEYYNMQDLMDCISKIKENYDPLQQVIGYDLSLFQPISQLKAAIKYPNSGLPILLFGEKGTGKSYLSRKCYEYCLSEKLILSQAQYEEIEIFLDDAIRQQTENKLFGEDGKKSLFEEMKGGFIFINDISVLDEQKQRIIANYIQSTKQDNLKTRLVLATSKNPYENLSEELLMNIPIICHIPPYRQRTTEEKEELILHFLLEEEKTIGKSIRISENLFQLLKEKEFYNNLDELRNLIQVICANAFSTQKDNQFVLDQTLLPISCSVKSKQNYHKLLDQEKTFLIKEYYQKSRMNKAPSYFDQLLDSHISYLNHQFSFKEFYNQAYNLMTSYFDDIVFSYHYKENSLYGIQEAIDMLLKAVQKQYQIEVPLHSAFVLARIISQLQKHGKQQLWEQKRKNDIQSIFNTMKEEFPKATMIAMEIRRNILEELDFYLSEMNLVFLILNIQFNNQNIQLSNTCGIIVAHGYSTASSIAQSCNQLLHANVLKAIDMPLDMETIEIRGYLQDFMKQYSYYQNLILMVDMGSLVGLVSYLHPDMNIGVINNISTGLAIEVGLGILHQKKMEDLLKDACEHAKCEYQIINYIKKEKAIIFTNDAGIQVSKQIVNMFKDSLMKKIDLSFVEYDYDLLMKNKENDPIFQQYNVVLMVKPDYLKIKHVPSISLEDIVGFWHIEQLHQVLSEYLTNDELEIFNQRLLKNFSLQNLMEKLTILNPSTLIDYVSDALTRLQQIMNRKFQNKVIVGLYIHISFLIERLVTKNAIETYEELSKFQEENKEFIHNVQISFSSILKHYNVSIPISEIAYLYDYIFYDETEKEEIK